MYENYKKWLTKGGIIGVIYTALTYFFGPLFFYSIHLPALLLSNSFAIFHVHFSGMGVFLAVIAINALLGVWLGDILFSAYVKKSFSPKRLLTYFVIIVILGTFCYFGNKDYINQSLGMCERVENPKAQSSCYFMQAEKLNNPEFCKKMVISAHYDIYAKYEYGYTVKQSIEDSVVDKASCYYSLATMNNNTSICLQIKDIANDPLIQSSDDKSLLIEGRVNSQAIKCEEDITNWGSRE